ncbi:hypothetical protein [Dethiothermospora halolimnae]|uniref:hypothetical protein n=1 Tax=Dethiothermospora halolimnae TaxID=3114390 RepID=UPI003CCBDA1B
MYKKNYMIFSIIILLIISNVIFAYFSFDYKSKYKENSKSNIDKIYILTGQNSKWKFEDGILALGPYKKIFSGEALEYIGDEKLHTDYLEVKVEIKEQNTDKTIESIFDVIEDGSDINKNILKSNKIFLGKSVSTMKRAREHIYNFNLDNYISMKIKYSIEGKEVIDTLRLKTKIINEL